MIEHTRGFGFCIQDSKSLIALGVQLGSETGLLLSQQLNDGLGSTCDF